MYSGSLHSLEICTNLLFSMHLLVVRGILAEDVQIGNHDNAISYVILGLQAKGFLQAPQEEALFIPGCVECLQKDQAYKALNRCRTTLHHPHTQ